MVIRLSGICRRASTSAMVGVTTAGAGGATVIEGMSKST